jgi:hypothetical protein
MKGVKNILCVLDRGPALAQSLALGRAAALALSKFAKLHVVHAWEVVGESVMRRSGLPLPEHQIHAHVMVDARDMPRKWMP